MSNPWGNPGAGTQAPAANLNLVHGIPGLAVDIYVVKNFNIFHAKELSDVTFGTVADLNTALPGFVTPGFYIIDIVGHGGNPFKPVLLTSTYLGAGQSKTAVAYVSASPAGVAGKPTLTVFTNNVSSTSGKARVTVAHTAVAPTVGVCADGSVPLVPAFSNGQQASAVVEPGFLPGDGDGPEQLLRRAGRPDRTRDPGADTTTLVYAIGTFPTTFTVASLVVPNDPVQSGAGWVLTAEHAATTRTIRQHAEGRPGGPALCVRRCQGPARPRLPVPARPRRVGPSGRASGPVVPQPSSSSEASSRHHPGETRPTG